MALNNYDDAQQDWDAECIAEALGRVAPLVDQDGHALVLLSDDLEVLRKFDASEYRGSGFSKMQLSYVSFLKVSVDAPRTPAFYVAVFLSKNHASKDNQLLAPALAALEPIKGGRQGKPALDGYQLEFIPHDSTRNVHGLQRPLEVMRHVIR